MWPGRRSVRGRSVLLKRVFAGLQLWVEGARLRYRCRRGALSEALRAVAREVRRQLIDMVEAGVVLPCDRTDWAGELAAELEERAGILTFDGGLEPEDAEHEAERLVRIADTRAFLDDHALLHHPVAPPASEAVAPFPGRWQARTG
jgi:hypothetical protein